MNQRDEESPDKKAIDKRNLLDEEVFTYRVNQENKVFIAWHGKQVTVLKGKDAQKFLSRIRGLDPKGAQLMMAKATGHFKHGNER